MAAKITLLRKTGCSKIKQSFLIKDCIFCCNILFLITRNLLNVTVVLLNSEQLKTTCYGCHTLFTQELFILTCSSCVLLPEAVSEGILSVYIEHISSFFETNVLIKTWQTQVNTKTAQALVSKHHGKLIQQAWQFLQASIFFSPSPHLLAAL